MTCSSSIRAMPIPSPVNWPPLRSAGRLHLRGEGSPSRDALHKAILDYRLENTR